MAVSDVLLVDEHGILRDGLRAILAATDDLRVVGEAAEGAAAIALARRLRPSLVVMEISLPQRNGIEATLEILHHCPQTRVVILSMYDDENSVVNAIRAEAKGFVLKQCSDGELLKALRTVVKGGTYLCPRVSDQLLTRMKRGDREDKRPARALDRLSPRELQVLRMVAGGKTSKEIAVLLDLELQTVRTYRETMMRKLNVSNVAGLTQLAFSADAAGPAEGKPLAEAAPPSVGEVLAQGAYQ